MSPVWHFIESNGFRKAGLGGIGTKRQGVRRYADEEDGLIHSGNADGVGRSCSRAFLFSLAYKYWSSIFRPLKTAALITPSREKPDFSSTLAEAAFVV